MMKIRWTGPDQYSHEYGTLMTGMELEVRADVGRAWIRDGWAEEVKPEAKAKKSKTADTSDDRLGG
jgi:hypothetical protein